MRRLRYWRARVVIWWLYGPGWKISSWRSERRITAGSAAVYRAHPGLRLAMARYVARDPSWPALLERWMELDYDTEACYREARRAFATAGIHYGGDTT